MKQREPNFQRIASVLLIPIMAIGVSCVPHPTPAPKDQLKLEPDIRHIPALVELPQSVGTVYPLDFLAYRHRDLVPGGKEVSFSVGTASIPVFDDVFPKVFKRVVALKHDDPTPHSEPLDAVIEPSIESVVVRVSPPLAGRWWFVWGRVSYKFQVKSQTGQNLISWNVTGHKEILGDRREDASENLFKEVLTGAIEDAGVQFMTSFYKVPEAKRFAKGLSQVGVNAETSAQITDFSMNGTGDTVIGQYPKIARVEVTPIPGATLAYDVTVENESSHRLFVRPLDILLTFENGEQITSAPVYAYGAWQFPSTNIPKDSSLAYIPPPPITLAPSYFGTYNLIFALIKVAEMQVKEQQRIEEKGKLDTYLKEHRGGELLETNLLEGQKLEGKIFFIPPEPSPKSEKAFLIVPVMDLDTATRFTVRLPIKIDGGAG